MFLDPHLHCREGGHGIGAVAGHGGRLAAQCDFLLRRGQVLLAVHSRMGLVVAITPRVVVFAVEVGTGSRITGFSQTRLAGPVSYRRGVDVKTFSQLPQPPQEPQSRLSTRALFRRLLLSAAWL